MPDEPTGPDRPSLEPPALFGKRKKTAPAAKAAPRPVSRPVPPPVSRETEPEAAATQAAPTARPVEPARPRRERRRRTPAPADTTPPLSPSPSPSPTAAATPTTTVHQPTTAVPAKERTPGGVVAALLGGLLTGLVLLALTGLGLRGCEAVQGTSSCGTGPGILALLLIFALTVVAGRFVLRALRVPDPGSTSFLAVGLTAVVVMLFLVDYLDQWAAIAAVPVISAASFVLAWWTTTTFVDAPHD